MSEIRIDQNGLLPEFRHSHSKTGGYSRSSLIFPGTCYEQDFLALPAHFIGDAGSQSAQILRVLRVHGGVCDQ